MPTETGCMEPDAEFDVSDVDNKMTEVSSDIDVSEGGEMFNIYDEKDVDVHEVHDSNMEPYIGMEFDSEEAAMAFYNAYAKRTGFIVRIGNCHRSSYDRTVVSRRLLCNKEGFRVNRKVKSQEVRKPREATREGCKAMIMVRKAKSGKWVVANLETRHSHPLGIPPGKVRRGSIPANSQDEKDKQIRELSAELHRTKQLLVECQRHLDTVLKGVQVHVDGLNRSIQHVIQNVTNVEDEHPRQLQV